MNLRVEQLFTERLKCWDERIAIKVGDHQVRYEELNRISNRLARRLIQEGVQKGDIVAVAASNIESFAIAALAILKAGAAYLGVDTRYPVERVREILVDASPAILLSDTEFPPQLLPDGLPIICDFAADAALAVFSDHPVDALGSADDAACIFYTSGSTGRPKGIEVAHRGIPSLVGDIDFVPFGPNDRIGQASNFAFDAINFELWGALLNGGCIVSIPKNVLFSATNVAEFFARERISVVWLTTSLFNALSTSRPDAFETLNALVIGGEAADPHSIGRVLRSGRAPRRLINAYGPTESTTFATWHELTLENVDAGVVPIGKPIMNMKVYVLDENMRAVRRGEPGELFISGPGIANGYLHHPELTYERFVPDLFGPDFSGRLYRTGDLCRELHDGNLEYLGRIDDQVKIRGFRVEPSEVAATLRKLPGVEDAIVLARNASFGTKELIAFVRGTELPPVEFLRREMAKASPDYMVPSIIRSVDEFPLTANGKLDRAALLTKVQSGSPGNMIGEQADEIEKRVALIWRFILQRDDFGLDQDYQALGGDSLSTMNLALEIEDTFGVTFSVEDLASPLTISRLAADVRARLGASQLNNSVVPLGTQETSFKVFAISYPWIMSRMPEEIGQALSAGRWRHLQVPFTYFRSADTITVEEMAIHLERMIYSLSPEGPYILYGHCVTGLLAYEVAQRVSAAGHDVSMVVIVDSYPQAARKWLGRARHLARSAVRFANFDPKTKIYRFFGMLLPARVLKYEEFIRQACVRASHRYRPRPYRGRLIFFRHSYDAEYIDEDPTAWRKLALGQYTEHIVDMHDQCRVTTESVQSGYREIAAKLKEIMLELSVGDKPSHAAGTGRAIISSPMSESAPQS